MKLKLILKNQKYIKINPLGIYEMSIKINFK